MIEVDKYNQSILSEIRSGKNGRDKVIKQLYFDAKLKNKISSMLLKKGANTDDVETVFNTSLMQFMKTVIKNKDLEVSTSIDNYIMGIARYVWYKELRQQIKNRSDEIEDQYDLSTDVTPESLVIDHSQKDLITELLSYLGKNCREVLMYWVNGYKMAEIADLVGYNSSNMARKKKYKCLKELLTFLDKNPHIKSILR